MKKQLNVYKPTWKRIVEAVDANPQITMSELCKVVHISNSSNILYHLRRLEANGLLKGTALNGQLTARRKVGARKTDKRWSRGEYPMPKMSKAEEKERIEMVVAKAKSSEQSVISEDVIRNVPGRLFRNDRLRAVRIG